MAAATIVHDTSEAVELCPPYGLYLKPITKMTISVALPQLKQPGKSISNWEVMERLKGMVHNHQFSTLRISKSTMDFIRFEGEVENKSLVKSFLACLDGKTIKLSGFSDILKVRAAEFKIDFPTRHDWDSFFRDAKDMNETLPGERPDTIHLEGLPCRWFALKESGSEKPSEEVLVKVFEKFGEIRNVDIPMLDPYREEMTGRNFHTFSFGGHLNFEAYVQYREYVGFIQAMSALRGMKLMYKGEDGKAVACNIKVSFDSTKHLSDASIKKRQLERQKLQELEQQREEQKRREKEAEERQRAEERKQKQLEELERERKREEKLRRREQKQRDRELRRSQKKLEKLQAQEQKQLQEKIRLEERKLLLAQRNLQSIRLVAELLSRAKAVKLQEQERKDASLRRQQLEERRRRQEAELRRVEEEKERALGLQRRERELRERLLSILLTKKADDPRARDELALSHAQLLQPVLDILHTVSAGCVGAAALHPLGGQPPLDTPKDTPPRPESDDTPRNGTGSVPEEAPCKGGPDSRLAATGDASPDKRCPGVLACIPDNNQQPKGLPATWDQNAPKKDIRSEQDKCNREPSGSRGRASGGRVDDERHKRERSRPRRAGSREDGRQPRKERRQHKKRSRQDDSPPRRSASPARSRARRSHSRERSSRRERSRDRRGGSGRKRSRHRRSERDRSRSGSPGRHRSTWNR
ncbi:A-kinase anchor protein 17A-like [Meles meles]|uniref:A-kinase anchor protein 17A-like n=1 Tax=Meles meles TaxID=9662 RepID=UPI001E69D8BC|nr:A-kinase anchor protein 17A-like [Meles meles]XP_045850975.1 A-kinase anchor protein 17A-like [Meles meles]XP_045852562.1 A-kinase anchor protein 17A-like [Meles meles]XP_045852563.1 A-kinase anchor protein 17A-like [Meles meles]